MTRLDDYCLDRFGFRPVYTLLMLWIFGTSAWISLSFLGWLMRVIESVAG